MAVAKVWDGTAWVRAIVGAKGDPGDPGIVIDEGSGFQDGDILVYDGVGDAWVPQPPVTAGKVLQVVSSFLATTVSSGGSWTSTGVSLAVSPVSSNSYYILEWTSQRSTDSGVGLERSAFDRIVDSSSAPIEGIAWVAYNDGPDDRVYTVSTVLRTIVDPAPPGPETYTVEFYLGSVSPPSVFTVTEIAK
jgi:hypothetical protein